MGIKANNVYARAENKRIAFSTFGYIIVQHTFLRHLLDSCFVCRCFCRHSHTYVSRGVDAQTAEYAEQ